MRMKNPDAIWLELATSALKDIHQNHQGAAQTAAATLCRVRIMNVRDLARSTEVRNRIIQGLVNAHLATTLVDADGVLKIEKV